MLLKILTLYILILDNQLHVVATSPEENKCQHTKYRNVGRVLGLSACARGEKKKKERKRKISVFAGNQILATLLAELS